MRLIAGSGGVTARSPDAQRGVRERYREVPGRRRLVEQGPEVGLEGSQVFSD
jgi:hypothetical protein